MVGFVDDYRHEGKAAERGELPTPRRPDHSQQLCAAWISAAVSRPRRRPAGRPGWPDHLGCSWAPSQFEEDGPAVFVAALAPAVGDEGDDLKASPLLGQFLEVPCCGDGAGAVVAYLYP